MKYKHNKYNKYIGITYPKFLTWKIWRKAIYYLWKKFLCHKHIHLFDEVASIEHYLYCDACGFSVHIAYTETEQEACNRSKNGLYIETTAVEKSEIDKNHIKQL